MDHTYLGNNMKREGYRSSGNRERAPHVPVETFKRWFSRVIPNYCHRTFILLYGRTARHNAQTKKKCIIYAQYVRGTFDYHCSIIHKRIEGDNNGFRPNIIILYNNCCGGLFREWRLSINDVHSICNDGHHNNNILWYARIIISIIMHTLLTCMHMRRDVVPKSITSTTNAVTVHAGPYLVNRGVW